MQLLSVTPIVAAAIWLLASGFATAQPQTPAENTQTTPQQKSGIGTAPENMGTTGWHGGRKDAPESTTGSNHQADATNAGETGINSDTEYATGLDLTGPAVHFPASKTPE